MVFGAALVISSAVSFSCPPTALRYLGDDLGKTLGQRVIIAKELANEVVVIEASGVTPEDLKSKFAQIVCGKWSESESGSLRLDLDREEEQKRYAAVVAKYVKAMEEWRKANLGAYEAVRNRLFDAKELAISLQTRKTDSRSPALPYMQLPVELYGQIAPQELAAGMLGTRAIYGASPTGLQQEIAGGEAIVKKRVQQSRELSTELRELGFGDPTTEFDLATQIGAGYAPRIEPGDAAVVLNFGGRKFVGNDYQQSMLFDEDGRMISSIGTLPSYRNLQSFAGMRPGVPREVKMEAGTAFVKERLAHFRDLTKRSAKLKKLAVDLPSSDPIAWYFGDAFNKWARDSDVDFAACLPDASLDFVANSELFYDIPQWLGEVEMDWSKDDSWWIANTWYPWEVRADRVDRVDFASVIGRMRRGESVNAAAQVSNVRELQATESLIFRNLTMSQPIFIPHMIARVASGGRSESIVPRLSSGTLQSMLRGVQMPWSQLPAADRQLIEREVCGRFGTVIYYSADMNLMPRERDWRKVEPSIWLARPEVNQAAVALRAQTRNEIALCLQNEGDQTHVNVYADRLPEGAVPFAIVRSSSLGFTVDLGGGVMMRSDKPVVEVEWLIERAPN